MKQPLKQWLIDVPVLLGGAGLVAFGLVMFTIPNDIAPGGVSGLATALCHATGALSVGSWSLLLNVPLAAAAWWKLGLRPLLRTLLATVLLSVLTDVFALFVPAYTNNPLLAACFGGASMGLGLGLLFIRGISTGGTDLLSMLVNGGCPTCR